MNFETGVCRGYEHNNGHGYLKKLCRAGVLSETHSCSFRYGFSIPFSGRLRKALNVIISEEVRLLVHNR